MSDIERTWLVIAYDTEIGGHMVFHVRSVASELMARRAVAEEFKRQGWGEIDPQSLDAYRLPQFRGNRNIAQICKVYPPKANEQPVSYGMPIVEFV